MISITLDIDWAPDEVVKYCLDLLNKSSIKATFFATHDSPILHSPEMKNHEIALHPNFLDNFRGAGRPYEEVINDIFKLAPDSIGLRFHSLAMSAPALAYCHKKGSLYDSSVYLPYQVKPYSEYTGIKRIPFIKSDLQALIDGEKSILPGNDYNKNLPFVYIFHPIHVFLNTYSLQHYQDAKRFYKDVKKLEHFRNLEHCGVENFLTEIINTYPQNNFYSMRDIYDKFS